jgi:hypothetical protein
MTLMPDNFEAVQPKPSFDLRKIGAHPDRRVLPLIQNLRKLLENCGKPLPQRGDAPLVPEQKRTRA